MSKKSSGEKKFSTSMFGFNKVDVNLYLESLIKSYNESLWEKENQISELKKEIDEHKRKNKLLNDELLAIGDTRNKIADAFLEAKRNAEHIVESARINAAMERHKLEAESETLRELISDRKESLRSLREAARNFGNDLETIMNDKIKLFREVVDRSVDESENKYIVEHIRDYSSVSGEEQQEVKNDGDFVMDVPVNAEEANEIVSAEENHNNDNNTKNNDDKGIDYHSFNY